MANSRNRWELEEKRKKQREQAVNAREAASAKMYRCFMIALEF